MDLELILVDLELHDRGIVEPPKMRTFTVFLLNQLSVTDALSVLETLRLASLLLPYCFLLLLYLFLLTFYY